YGLSTDAEHRLADTGFTTRPGEVAAAGIGREMGTAATRDGALRRCRKHLRHAGLDTRQARGRAGTAQRRRDPGGMAGEQGLDATFELAGDFRPPKIQ